MCILILQIHRFTSISIFEKIVLSFVEIHEIIVDVFWYF